jgi:hypothetical protein
MVRRDKNVSYVNIDSDDWLDWLFCFSLSVSFNESTVCIGVAAADCGQFGHEYAWRKAKVDANRIWRTICKVKTTDGFFTATFLSKWLNLNFSVCFIHVHSLKSFIIIETGKH